MSRQERLFSKWEWAVMDRQSFSLISKSGMPEGFVREAEQAAMDAVGDRTGRWIAHIDEEFVSAAGSNAVIALRRAGGETINATVCGWKAV